MSTLKVVDFSAIAAKETVFWRAMLRHFLLCFKDGDSLQEVLRRTAGKTDLPRQLRHFLKQVVGPWAAAQAAPSSGAVTGNNAQERLLLRVRLAELCLKSAQRER